MKPSELERFAAWALGRYSKRSVAKLRADVRTMVQNKGEPPESQRRAARLKDYAWAWDVWGDAREDGCELSELPIPRPVVPAAPKRGGRLAKTPKLVRENVAMSSIEHESLIARLEQVKLPAARVLEIMARSGLRIGDVLRVKIEALRSALQHGPEGSLPLVVKGDKATMVKLGVIHDAWARAYATSWRGAQTLADAVTGKSGSDTEASGAAYERCRRLLKRLGAEMISGRIHLHRLRRTVAVELLRKGASHEDVQQVLIQEDVAVTKKYTNEYRAEQAAAALKLLQKERKS